MKYYTDLDQFINGLKNVSDFTTEVNQNISQYIKEFLDINSLNFPHFSDKYNEDIAIPNINRIKSGIDFLEDEKYKSMIIYGKVQSGKTLNSILTSALLFENGYDIVIFLAGTINILKEQNLKRFELFEEAFNNKHYIKFLSSENHSYDFSSVASIISRGETTNKIFIPVLKEKSNLEYLTQKLDEIYEIKNLKIAIIDDEADIASVNNTEDKIIPKQIIEILKKTKSCYCAITATPFANILDENEPRLKPKYIVPLKESGEYFGMKKFHAEDSEKIVTNGFDENLDNSLFEFSKLIINNINLIYKTNKELINKKNFQILINPGIAKNTHTNTKNKLKKYIEKTISLNPDLPFSKDDFEYSILNAESNSLHNQKSKFNLIIGGNLLSRGVTFESLLMELITNFNEDRFSITTLIQRCRWFGYRKEFYNYMKIAMSNELSNLYKRFANFEKFFFNLLGNGMPINPEIINKIEKEMKNRGLL